MLSFLGPIISLVSAPVKSYMEERTAKVQSKAKIAEGIVIFLSQLESGITLSLINQSLP